MAKRADLAPASARAQRGLARLGRFGAMIPHIAAGDEILLTWVPERGTKVTVRGTDRGVIEGRDFADALFAVWIGPNPVQEDLKKALLGD